MKVLQMLLVRLPPWLASLLSHVLSLAAGALAAVILHYILYRIDLPSKPFIYVAF
ncbi:MAG: hypothetical protein WC485_08260 [Opitutaceae bacterium]